jgi:hypothetical protein
MLEMMSDEVESENERTRFSEAISKVRVKDVYAQSGRIKTLFRRYVLCAYQYCYLCLESSALAPYL